MTFRPIQEVLPDGRQYTGGCVDPLPEADKKNDSRDWARRIMKDGKPHLFRSHNGYWWCVTNDRVGSALSVSEAFNIWRMTVAGQGIQRPHIPKQ